VARIFRSVLPLRLVAPPLELPRATYWQLWHQRTHQDPAHKWLRTVVAEAVAASAAVRLGDHGEQGGVRAAPRQAVRKS
jgi:DNA-binding transcriptional LysR family regulator